MGRARRQRAAARHDEAPAVDVAPVEAVLRVGQQQARRGHHAPHARRQRLLAQRAGRVHHENRVAGRLGGGVDAAVHEDRLSRPLAAPHRRERSLAGSSREAGRRGDRQRVALERDRFDPRVRRVDGGHAAGSDPAQPLLSAGEDEARTGGDRAYRVRVEPLHPRRPHGRAEEALARPEEELAARRLDERAGVERAPAGPHLAPRAAAAHGEAARLERHDRLAGPERERGRAPGGEARRQVPAVRAAHPARARGDELAAGKGHGLDLGPGPGRQGPRRRREGHELQRPRVLDRRVERAAHVAPQPPGGPAGRGHEHEGPDRDEGRGAAGPGHVASAA